VYYTLKNFNTYCRFFARFRPGGKPYGYPALSLKRRCNVSLKNKRAWLGKSFGHLLVTAATMYDIVLDYCNNKAKLAK
jgi:hypothetical protein